MSTDNKKINFDLLNKEDATALNATIETIDTYIEDESVKTLDESGQNEYYEKVVAEFNKLISQIRTMRISFALNAVEAKYMYNVITEKITYKPGDLFVALRVKDSILDKYPKPIDAFDNEYDVPLTADLINILNYVLNLHTVTGIKPSAITFAKVYEKIGEAAKVFNHWDIVSKNLQQKIDNWSLLILPEVVAPELNKQEEIITDSSSKKLEPINESENA